MRYSRWMAGAAIAFCLTAVGFVPMSGLATSSQPPPPATQVPVKVLRSTPAITVRGGMVYTSPNNTPIAPCFLPKRSVVMINGRVTGGNNPRAPKGTFVVMLTRLGPGPNPTQYAPCGDMGIFVPKRFLPKRAIEAALGARRAPLGTPKRVPYAVETQVSAAVS